MVLMSLLHSVGNPMLSEKSLQVLLCRLRGEQPPTKPKRRVLHYNTECANLKPAFKVNQSLPKDGWLELRKEWTAYLQRDTLFLFNRAVSSIDFSEVFPAPTIKNRVFALPMPSLELVLSDEWSNGRAARVAGKCVQWGAWSMRAVAVPASAMNAAEVTNGLIAMEYQDGAEAWWNASTFLKQASFLPWTLFPTLVDPILAGAYGNSGSRADGATRSTLNEASSRLTLPEGGTTMHTTTVHAVPVPEPDFFKLLGGKFSYTLMIPLPPPSQSSWRYDLTHQPNAKLLPLRQLDKQLRRIVPVIAPSRRQSDQARSFQPSNQAALAEFNCLIEIQYKFTGW
jgi:hypothetical protein